MLHHTATGCFACVCVPPVACVACLSLSPLVFQTCVVCLPCMSVCLVGCQLSPHHLVKQPTRQFGRLLIAADSAAVSGQAVSVSTLGLYVSVGRLVCCVRVCACFHCVAV